MLVGIDRLGERAMADAEAAVTAMEQELIAILGASRLPDVHADVHAPGMLEQLAGLAAPEPLTLFSPLIGAFPAPPGPPRPLSAPFRDMLLRYWPTKLRAAPSVHIDPTIAIFVDSVLELPQN